MACRIIALEMVRLVHIEYLFEEGIDGDGRFRVLIFTMYIFRKQGRFTNTVLPNGDDFYVI